MIYATLSRNTDVYDYENITGKSPAFCRAFLINKNRAEEYTIRMKYILFTGGGSGGHVVPNLAIMRELEGVVRLGYVGTDGMEKKLVLAQNYRFFTVNTPKLQRKFTLSNLKIPFSLLQAVRSAERILREEKPDLIFSKGGYASFPVAWAAKKFGIPLLTHESDLSPGLCTKLLAKRCKYVLTTFERTADQFANGVCVGSPMRRELFASDKASARLKYRFPSQKPVLLVLGGGSGCRAFNEFVARNLDGLLRSYDILHLCGRGNAPTTQKSGYVPLEFESDMGSAYACADLVLARAGSNTLFELLALKKPALFVPLKKGSRGDQVQNAEYFSSQNLCRVLSETDLPSKGVCALDALTHDENLRKNLSRCNIHSGTENIVKIIKKQLNLH